MPAFLVAFDDDPERETEYICDLVWVGAGIGSAEMPRWQGRVRSRVRRKVPQRLHDGSQIQAWEYDQPTALYTGPARDTQAGAAADAENWCREHGITAWMGPVMSGAGTNWVIAGGS